MGDSEFRLYNPDADLFGADGYPAAWHDLKHLVREQAGHRCVRCGHPFVVGETPGEWSPCDEGCYHGGRIRLWNGAPDGDWVDTGRYGVDNILALIVCREGLAAGWHVQAHWRVLTVHHLDGNKANCRWWNLVALCQRCHLEIQGKVRMDRPWPWPHTDWMKPYAAGFYAFKYLGMDLPRDIVMMRLDALLEKGIAEEAVERLPL